MFVEGVEMTKSAIEKKLVELKDAKLAAELAEADFAEFANIQN